MKPFKFLLAALLLLFATTGSGWAQLSGAGTGDKPKAEPQITEPQTQEAVRELLSGLDDTQVRELLLKRMSDEVDRRARALAAENETSFTDTARFYARSLRTLIVDAVSKALFCLNVEFPVNRWRWPGGAAV